ncbi:MAG: hypothetical protein KW802_00165 [Candidatus Doudnabacteria bacterium]|nr:hypothetical protein [Candidatus Doudnabacteria bacterium]
MRELRNIIWFLALFILLLLQGGILIPLHIAPVGLIVIIIALAPVLSEFKQGLIVTLLGGLLLDLASGAPDGLITMSLLSMFLIVHVTLKEFLSREPNKFILGSSVALGTIIYYISFVGFSRLFVILHLLGKPDISYLLQNQLPRAVIWNLIFTYPMFYYYLLTQNLVSKGPSHEEPIRT